MVVHMADATTYSRSITFTFDTEASLPFGLVASNYTVKGTPKERKFVPQNAYVGGGYLNLLVNGGQQHDGVVWSGEVCTTFTIESASVETYAILSEVPGVCNGEQCCSLALTTECTIASKLTRYHFRDVFVPARQSRNRYRVAQRSGF